jgi:hypothetical protein
LIKSRKRKEPEPEEVEDDNRFKNLLKIMKKLQSLDDDNTVKAML